MSHVREIEAGAIRVALGSALNGALKGKSQTFVSYVKFDSGSGTDWLVAFQNESNGGAESWSSFGKESGALRFFPGGSGTTPNGGVWGLAVATWNQETSTFAFYFYNFVTEILEELGTGSNSMSWSGTPPARVQFGLWNGSEEFHGKYAACAIFGGKAMTKTEIKALAASKSVEAWAALEPTALWIFDQKGSGEKVVDLMGHGADQGAIPQGETTYVESTLPLVLREGEEGGGEPEPEKNPGAEKPTLVAVKTEAGLEAVKRYVKTESGLVEIT